MVTYRVHSPIVGFEEAQPGMKVVSFKVGSILKVASERIEHGQNGKLGTVEAAFDGRIVNVFAQDLKDCAERQL
jgi:hypothetical protein